MSSADLSGSQTGVGSKVKGSPKLSQYILRGTWIFVPFNNCRDIHGGATEQGFIACTKCCANPSILCWDIWLAKWKN